MFLKIKITDIEWDDYDYDDLSEEEQAAFRSLPKEMFVVLATDRGKAPTILDFERDHLLSFELATTVTDVCNFSVYDWNIVEVTEHDEWPDGIPENCVVYPIKSEDKRTSSPAGRSGLDAGDSGVPKVVFEIEQDGKRLELVRVPSTEYKCSDCCLSSGDYPACAVCEALTNWETRGGRYIFKEKEASDGRTSYESR